LYKENEVNQVYLSIKQHDQFRTLLMGFEIPFRGYIADVLMTHYSSANDLETALLAKNASLTPADPFFLRDVLPNSVKHSKIEKMYHLYMGIRGICENSILAAYLGMVELGRPHLL